MGRNGPGGCASDVVRGARLALLRNSRKTERGAKQFLLRLVVRAAPFALLRNSRKTERGASQFLIRLVVRAAPIALLKKRSHLLQAAREVLCIDGA